MPDVPCGIYASAGKSSLWRGMPMPESFPWIIGGGGAAPVGYATGGRAPYRNQLVTP